jgi:beta-lactamase regulating signal transducer with metallopeptidase domain
MSEFFTGVLNMTFTASIVIGLIIVIRFILNKKLPKSFSYALWIVVLVRLLVPVTVSSGLSLFNFLPSPVSAPVVQKSQNIETVKQISHNAVTMQKPSVDTGSRVVDEATGGALPAAVPKAPVDPRQVIILISALIWALGAVSLFTYGFITYIKIAKRLNEAVLYKGDAVIAEAKAVLRIKREIKVFTSDRINTPVVYGMFKPSIILPLSITQDLKDKALQFISSHELVHIKRFDYIIKPLAFLALCIHWFNPMVWLSFFLAQKDMEMSCDERVVAAWEEDIRSEYATLLINLAAKPRYLLEGGLLAFGESDIKSRIEGIDGYKRPAFRLLAVSVVTLGNHQKNRSKNFQNMALGPSPAYAVF